MNREILKLDAPYNIIYAEALLDRAEERAEMMGNESYIQLSYRSVAIALSEKTPIHDNRDK